MLWLHQLRHPLAYRGQRALKGGQALGFAADGV